MINRSLTVQACQMRWQCFVGFFKRGVQVILIRLTLPAVAVAVKHLRYLSTAGPSALEFPFRPVSAKANQIQVLECTANLIIKLSLIIARASV